MSCGKSKKRIPGVLLRSLYSKARNGTFPMLPATCGYQVRWLAPQQLCCSHELRLHNTNIADQPLNGHLPAQPLVNARKHKRWGCHKTDPRLNLGTLHDTFRHTDTLDTVMWQAERSTPHSNASDDAGHQHFGPQQIDTSRILLAYCAKIIFNTTGDSTTGRQYSEIFRNSRVCFCFFLLSLRGHACPFSWKWPMLSEVC